MVTNENHVFIIGHVAQPHYLGSIKSEPEDNSYYSAAPSKGFISQDNNNNTRNIEEGYNNVSDIIAPSSLRLSPALLAVLCYFFGTFGGFIIMILEKKNLFVIFHGWQSFACGVIAFIFQLLFIFSSTMYRLLWIVYLIFTFVMIIKVISDAPTQRLTKGIFANTRFVLQTDSLLCSSRDWRLVWTQSSE